MGFGQNAGVPNHHRRRGGDVHRLHLQLHRTHHRHPQCRRPVRLCASGIRARLRLLRRRRHADRVRVRAARHRLGDRSLSGGAVPGRRSEAGGLRRLCDLRRAQHRRREDRRQLRAGGDRPGHRRAAGLHGCRGAGLLLGAFYRPRMGWRSHAKRSHDRRRLRRHPLRHLVLPRHRGRRHGGGRGDHAARHPARLHQRHRDPAGASLRCDDLRGRRGRLAPHQQH